MSTDLARQWCRPMGPADALAADAIAAHLAAAPGWALAGDAIEKSYFFNDFQRALAFVNAVAWIAESQDHHPEIALEWGRCTLRWATHSARGVTLNDFICAARADALVRMQLGPPAAGAPVGQP